MHWQPQFILKRSTASGTCYRARAGSGMFRLSDDPQPV